MIIYKQLNIHGDNIVECERAFDLIKTALAKHIEHITGPKGSASCPIFEIFLKSIKEPLTITFFPGFGRWNEDILSLIRKRGGTLREAADVIITSVQSGLEEPLIAIEYCGALPAGNQVWQRSGRAYSFGLARVPYLYVAELGGYELNGNRERQASRMPNPAIPFSYLSYYIEQDTPVIPIFMTSPGADESSRQKYADEFGDNGLITLMRSLLMNENPNNIYELLHRKVIALVKKQATDSKNSRTLTSQQWESLYNTIKKRQSLVQFLVDQAPLKWSKTAYIAALTTSAKKLMRLASKYGIGLTSTQLPMCIIPNKNVNTDLKLIKTPNEKRIKHRTKN